MHYVSPHTETLLGFSVQEWLTDPERWVKQLHPIDRDRVVDAFNDTFVAGIPFKMEYRLVRTSLRFFLYLFDCTGKGGAMRCIVYPCLMKLIVLTVRGSYAIDEPWKVEDRGEKPAIALKGR
jgi:hypothetical protein